MSYHSLKRSLKSIENPPEGVVDCLKTVSPFLLFVYNTSINVVSFFPVNGFLLVIITFGRLGDEAIEEILSCDAPPMLAPLEITAEAPGNPVVSMLLLP